MNLVFYISVPSNYGYLSECSMLRPLFDFLVQAGKTGALNRKRTETNLPTKMYMGYTCKIHGYNNREGSFETSFGIKYIGTNTFYPPWIARSTDRVIRYLKNWGQVNFCCYTS